MWPSSLLEKINKTQVFVAFQKANMFGVVYISSGTVFQRAGIMTEKAHFLESTDWHYLTEYTCSVRASEKGTNHQEDVSYK